LISRIDGEIDDLDDLRLLHLLNQSIHRLVEYVCRNRVLRDPSLEFSFKSTPN